MRKLMLIAAFAAMFGSGAVMAGDDTTILAGITLNSDMKLGATAQVCEERYCLGYLTTGKTATVGYDVTNITPDDNTVGYQVQPTIGYNFENSQPVMGIYAAVNYETDDNYSPEAGIYVDSQRTVVGVAGARFQEVDF